MKPRTHLIDDTDVGFIILYGALKQLAHIDLAKKKENCMNFYCFMCDYYVALISALVLLKCGNLRITVVVS